MGVRKRWGLIPPNASNFLSILRLYYPEIYASPCTILGNSIPGTVCPEGSDFKMQRVGAGSSSLACKRWPLWGHRLRTCCWFITSANTTTLNVCSSKQQVLRVPIATGQWYRCMSRWKDLWIAPPIRDSLRSTPLSMQLELKCWFSHWGGACFCECCSLSNPTEGLSFPGQTGCLIQWAEKLNLSFFMEDGLSCAGSSYEFLQITTANAVFTYLPRCTFFCISLHGLGSLEIWMTVFTF